jgi:hypothetical protein
LLEAKGCKVTGLKRESDTLEFDRLDDGLPINFGFLAVFNYRFVPIPGELDRYGLTVKNLPRGQYEIVAAGRLVGRFSDQQFAAGLNIATATPDAWQPGGPWDAQWTALAPLTEARDQLMLSRSYARTFMEKHPRLAGVDEQVAAINEKLQTLQRAIARPVPYHFVIGPAKQ